jgi:hypothetical protein
MTMLPTKANQDTHNEPAINDDYVTIILTRIIYICEADTKQSNMRCVFPDIERAEVAYLV